MDLQVDTILRTGELITLLGGGGLIIFKLGRVTERVETYLAVQTEEIRELKEESKKIGSILTTIAVQDSRLDRFEADMHDLKRGKGWINPLSNSG